MGGSGSSAACARAGGRVLLGRLHGPRAQVGGQAGSARLARKAEQAWAAAASSFSFLFYLLPIWLGFDLFSFIVQVCTLIKGGA